jgi:hypothetical protein
MVFSGTLHLNGREPWFDCGFHHAGSNHRHATMIGGAAAQKARTAVRLLLDDGASRSYRSGAVWIGRAKDGNHGQSDSCRNMHGARIITNKKMAM